MRKEITVKSIAALERAGGRITDTKIRGFVARCLPSGNRLLSHLCAAAPAFAPHRARYG
jgi:hypothetical protein